MQQHFIKITFEKTITNKFELTDNKSAKLIIIDKFKCSPYIADKIITELKYLVDFINKNSNQNSISFYFNCFSFDFLGIDHKFNVVKENGYSLAPRFFINLEDANIYTISKNNIFNFYNDLINLLLNLKLIEE